MTTIGKKYQYEAEALTAKAMITALEAHMHEVAAYSELWLDKDLNDDERDLCQELEDDERESVDVTLQFGNHKLVFKPLVDADTYDHLVWLLQDIEQSALQAAHWIDDAVRKAGYSDQHGEVLYSTDELKTSVHKH